MQIEEFGKEMQKNAVFVQVSVKWGGKDKGK
jgi:hypothetical protein